MKYFTSDWHIGHYNVIKHSNRPFANVDEMNDCIISNCNAIVKPNDELYFSGDLTMHAHVSRIIDIRSKINCRHFHFIFGNHDSEAKKKKAKLLDYFDTMENLMELKVDLSSYGVTADRIVLCHYAMKVWRNSHHGSYHLYGHSHGSLPDDPHSLSFDVGVDCWDFKPVSLDQVVERMKTKQWKPVDHHR